LKIDAANKKVLCRSKIENSLVGNREFSLEYDYLVIAVGAKVNTFNTPGVEENCHFLKVNSFQTGWRYAAFSLWLLLNAPKALR
jgi:NADH dehydrogenase FAD-containing subunit